MDRKSFIRFWAEFVRSHEDKVWSAQQKILIDSQINSVREFYRKNPEIMAKVLERMKKEKI